MPKAQKKKPEGWWVPPAGKGDYTKSREKWDQDEKELLAAVKRRSAARKRRKAS